MPERWPSLPLDAWRDTYATLHMWTQVVGKICLALTPLTNHFWNIAFQITPRGLTTPTMTAGTIAVTIAFDFVDHQVVIRTSDRREQKLPLEPMTVADFHSQLIQMLSALGVRVRIWTTPVEIPDPIPFEQDIVHHSYDRSQVESFHGVLLATKPVFESFRSAFIGKCSPLHFFWGSFDVAVTRFSGDRAPERPGADSITREAYSHAVISHGFWPGSGAVQEPAFYAYAAPEPEGLKQATVKPAAAYYHGDMSEFILPYEAVRTASSPPDELLVFLRSTYDAAAELAGWNRSSLERSPRVEHD
jgi:Family of unknown function (DUF5996)